MAKKAKTVLTLDQQITYQIKVPGELNTNWAGGMTVKVEMDDETGEPVSTLIGTFDQAALHGLLRRLYSLGIPLISVICLDFV